MACSTMVWPIFRNRSPRTFWPARCARCSTPGRPAGPPILRRGRDPSESRVPGVRYGHLESHAWTRHDCGDVLSKGDRMNNRRFAALVFFMLLASVAAVAVDAPGAGSLDVQ